MRSLTETLSPAPPKRRLPLVPLGVLSDAVLVRRVGQGDQRAFEQLYTRYRDQLFRYCAAIVRRPEDAEDALQAAMTNAYRALARGDGAGEVAVRAWLYRIAHNECINLMRRRVPSEELTGAEAAGGEGVADRAERAAEVRQLTADLATLSPRPRSALVLRELSGLSHEEIGQALGASPAVAKQLIYEARMALEELAEGRSLPCAEVRQTLSDGDRRALRGRRLNAHLRACTGCRAFRERLESRPGVLASVVPGALPALAGQRILEAVLGSVAGGGGGAIVAAGAGAASGGAASALAVKAAAVLSAGALAGAGVVAGPTLVHHRTSSPSLVRAATARAPWAPAANPALGTAGQALLPVLDPTVRVVPTALRTPGGGERAGRPDRAVAPERPHRGSHGDGARTGARSVHQPVGPTRPHANGSHPARNVAGHASQRAALGAKAGRSARPQAAAARRSLRAPARAPVVGPAPILASAAAARTRHAGTDRGRVRAVTPDAGGSLAVRSPAAARSGPRIANQAPSTGAAPRDGTRAAGRGDAASEVGRPSPTRGPGS